MPSVMSVVMNHDGLEAAGKVPPPLARVSGHL